MNGTQTRALRQPVAGNNVWLTLRHAAARAAVSEATIKREVRAGRIRFARVGGRRCLRFRPEWIDTWLEASVMPIESASRSA